MRFLLALFFLFGTYNSFAQIGIGTTTPHQSAQLEVSSSTKGFLPPRLSTLQRDSIVNPADGLLIFNTTKSKIEYFSNGVWNTIIGVCSEPTVATITGPDTVAIGYTSQLANATTGGVWATSNASIATVNTSGLVSGVADGTVIISYTKTEGGCSRTESKTMRVIPSPAIGSTLPSGGIVFYKDATGYHGLAAFPSNLQARSGTVLADRVMKWGCSGQLINGLVGTGREDTRKIVEQCAGPSAVKTVSEMSANLAVFLPSTTEFNLMKNVLSTLPNSALNPNDTFWTSGQQSASTAYMITGNGFIGEHGKDALHKVRAVYSF